MRLSDRCVTGRCQRRAVETFFKWIKQNLSIKYFFGNSINAVKSPIWIAVCVYLIVNIARKRLNLPASPQLLLNIFEVNPEKLNWTGSFALSSPHSGRVEGFIIFQVQF